MRKMHQMLATAAIILCAFSACKSGPGTLTGEIKDYKGAEIECMLVTDSAFTPDSVTVSEDGTFIYTRDLPEGAEIWIGSEDVSGYIRTYLKNGDKQHIVLSASADSIYSRCAVTFGGDTKAPEYLLAFDKELGNPMKWVPEEGTPFKTFKANLDAAAEKLKAQLKTTGDSHFIAKEEKKLKHAVLATVFGFIRNKVISKQPADEDKNFVDFVESIDYNDMDIAKGQLVNMYIFWYQACHPDTTTGRSVRFLTILKQRVSNQEVIDYLANNYMESYMNEGADAYLPQVLEVYEKITTSTENVEKYKAMSRNLAKLLPGSMAPDFPIKDIKGNVTKFSDFIGKGKVVYLDVWATWCGPCCAEIPYMEKVAKHYAGNSKIEIISVSLDEKADKWKKKLETDKPQWKQFIAPEGMKSELCKEYKINGIPRFMLFDKEGKIITTNALRPSDENIIGYLDNQLK